MKQPKLFFLLVAFYSFVTFGRSVLPTHLAAEGLSLFEILFGSFLVIAAQLVTIFALGIFKKDYRAKLIWYVAATFYALFFFLTGFKIFSVSQYFIGSLLAGLGSVLFYLFYNLSYFKETAKEKLYSRSSDFFNVLIGVGIIVPVITGLLASATFTLVVGLSALFFIATLFIIKKQDNFIYSFSIIESLKKARGAKLIVILAGINDSLGWGIVAIFSLRFLKTPFEFGAFLTYLAFASLIANVVFSRLGEKYAKGYLVSAATAFIVAILNIFMGLSTYNFIFWLLANGLSQIISPLFNSSSLALSLERSEDNMKMLPAREILINFGRFIGLAAACIFFYFNLNPLTMFLAPSLAAFFLGVLALRKKHQIIPTSSS